MIEATSQIKARAREISEAFGDTHGERAVDDFAQFSLGVAAIVRNHGLPGDVIDAMKPSAGLAAMNAADIGVDPDPMAHALLGDEQLCQAIIKADSEIQ